MSKGDDRFDMEFLEGVLRRQPNYVHALVALAEIYTANNLYEKGLELDKRLAKLCPSDVIVFYNLACSYALLDHKEEAIAALDKSIRLGYCDWDHMRKDPDLKSLHSDERFKSFLTDQASPAQKAAPHDKL